jgi:hypothetical protein
MPSVIPRNLRYEGKLFLVCLFGSCFRLAVCGLIIYISCVVTLVSVAGDLIVFSHFGFLRFFGCADFCKQGCYQQFNKTE